MTVTDPTRIAFVCVQNAGRSQMAYAFARRALDGREFDSDFEILTGGTRPAGQIHPEVIDAMEEIGIDVSERTPSEISIEELRECDYVITMGCSDSDVCPAGWAGENRKWDLEDPDGRSRETVAEIRDEIERRVTDLFEELETRTAG